MDEELDEWVDGNQVAWAAVTHGGFGRGGEREEVALCWAGLLRPAPGKSEVPQFPSRGPLPPPPHRPPPVLKRLCFLS